MSDAQSNVKNDLRQKMEAVIGCTAIELRKEIAEKSFTEKACELLILKELLQEQNINENSNSATR